MGAGARCRGDLAKALVFAATARLRAVGDSWWIRLENEMVEPAFSRLASMHSAGSGVRVPDAVDARKRNRIESWEDSPASSGTDSGARGRFDGCDRGLLADVQIAQDVRAWKRRAARVGPNCRQYLACAACLPMDRAPTTTPGWGAVQVLWVQSHRQCLRRLSRMRRATRIAPKC